MERDPDLFPVEVDELDEEPNHPSAFARHEHVPNRIEVPEGCSEVILVDLLRAKIRDLALNPLEISTGFRRISGPKLSILA